MDGEESGLKYWPDLNRILAELLPGIWETWQGHSCDGCALQFVLDGDTHIAKGCAVDGITALRGFMCMVRGCRAPVRGVGRHR